MIKLSIIIISFNTQDLIVNLLDSLKRAVTVCQRYGLKIEVIILDNHSRDESVKIIKQKFPWVRLYLNKMNFGFARATNQGILKAEGELILLLNSDTLVFDDTLLKTIRFMDQHPQAGALTCRVELPGGRIDPASHRGFPTPWSAFCYFFGLEKIFPKIRIFAGYHQGWKNLKETHEVDACAGSFFMVRKSVIDKIGLLDERFFMYAEDLDWAYRIKKAGYKIYYFPETKIVHYKHGSGIKKVNNNLLKAEDTNEIKLKSRNVFFETMKVFYEKHYQKKYPKIVKNLVFFGIYLASKLKK